VENKMHRIKSLNEQQQKSQQVNYLNLVNFSDVTNILPKELEIITHLRKLPNYYPYDYNKDIKQVFGEI